MNLISFFLKRYVKKHSKIKTVLLIRNFKSLNRNIFANVYIYKGLLFAAGIYSPKTVHLDTCCMFSELVGIHMKILPVHSCLCCHHWMHFPLQYKYLHYTD